MAPRIDTEEVERILERRGRGNGKELQVFAIQHLARRLLPYGKWTCADGREVVFNREYQPIYQRKDGEFSHANRDEWVEGIKNCVMYYDDGDNPAFYLLKHLGFVALDRAESTGCRKALMRCFTVMKEFSPKEHSSVSRQWSLRF